MPKLVITRKSEFLNRLKRFSVLVNGKTVGAVKSGGTEEFEIAEGQQEIECKVNWYYSNRYLVDAKEGQTIYLQVKNNTNILMIAFFIVVALLLVSVYLKRQGLINETAMENIRFSYFGLILVYFVYTFSIGRKKYLLLQPDSSNPFAN